MRGAKGVLINITGGSDVTLFEVDEAANSIRDEVETEAHIIFGSCFDESLQGRIRVSVVATGIEAASGHMRKPILIRDETRAVSERPIEIRTEQPPSMRPAAIARNVFGVGPSEATAASSTPAAPGVGSTLAPASATTRPPVNELDLATRVANSTRDGAILSAPAAQMDEIAEAMAHAPAVTPKPAMPRQPADTFIPKAPVMPRAMPAAEQRPASAPLAAPAMPATPAQVAPAQPLASDQAQPEASKLSLFSRYRSLAKGKPESAPTATAEGQGSQEALMEPLARTAPPAAPQPKPLAQPAPAPQSSLAISVNPADRPVTSHDEEELEIPAFLRRQAN